MRTLRVSVRRLVEFLLRTGDINSEGVGRAGVEAMLAGSDIHRRLQAAGGKAYQAEVPLAASFFFPGGSFNPSAARLDICEKSVANQEGFFLRVEGRADGIIDNGTRPLLVDEIKGVSRDVSDLNEPLPLHEAQALCYAYLHLRSTKGASALSSAFGDRVVVRLSYVSMTTGELRQLERMHDAPSIEAWFFSLLDKAQRWAAWRVAHDKLRDQSLTSLQFPLRPRAAQKDIMEAVAGAIHENSRLYLQAPTGSGKTLATLYPTLKAMGTGEVLRIAFLTAKTMTRGPVLESLELLRQRGVATNALVMTARDKICPLRAHRRDKDVRARPLASLCNPVECPLARGHYDAANDALFEAISGHDVLDSTCFEEVAARHHVCPYELQRDAARWADIVICDYHYAFAPSASLLGLADEPDGAGTVYLVDEAHNLVERMREMYSAELGVSDLRALERALGPAGRFAELTQAVRAALSAFPAWDKALQTGARPDAGGRARRPLYQRARIDDAFAESLTTLAEGMRSMLDQLAEEPVGETAEVFFALRDASFAVNAFLGALNRSETGYVSFLGRDERGGRRLKIFCVDPSHNLAERLEQAKAAVFFSGTLLPLDYHLRLLAAQDEDKSLSVQSGFDPRHQQVFIGTDISARFSQRGSELYAHIVNYLVTLTQAHPGNYLAFLPSYAMMEEVSEALGPLVGGKVMLARQQSGMREGERERFVGRFLEKRDAGTSLVGLCVLGGIFGESIDLPGEALVGVVVVGTGMPRASAEREVIRDYFDAREGKGFAYAYTYPGLNKVLQAAGRLIRGEQDHGVVLLLDDRFCEKELQREFPREWTDVRCCTLETLPSMMQ